MAEHLADSFDSDTALLKGRIIKDGTSVIFVSMMLLKDGMEAQGDFGKEYPPVDASVQ